MLTLRCANERYLFRSSSFAYARNDEARDVINRDEDNPLNPVLVLRVAQVNVPQIVWVLADDWVPASDEFPFAASI